MRDDDRKIVTDTILACDNAHGLGEIEANFEAERYPDTPLLDTRVELTIAPFAITWLDRDKLVRELNAVITKYLI